MCERQHKRGSLLSTREETDRVLRIPLRNTRLPISVLELTKNVVDEASILSDVQALCQSQMRGRAHGGLRCHCYESSESATARQHKVAEVACY